MFDLKAFERKYKNNLLQIISKYEGIEDCSEDVIDLNIGSDLEEHSEIKLENIIKNNENVKEKLSIESIDGGFIPLENISYKYYKSFKYNSFKNPILRNPVIFIKKKFEYSELSLDDILDNL